MVPQGTPLTRPGRILPANHRTGQHQQPLLPLRPCSPAAQGACMLGGDMHVQMGQAEGPVWVQQPALSLGGTWC